MKKDYAKMCAEIFARYFPILDIYDITTCNAITEAACRMIVANGKCMGGYKPEDCYICSMSTMCCFWRELNTCFMEMQYRNSDE